MRALLQTAGICVVLVLQNSTQDTDARAILDKGLKAQGDTKAPLKVTALNARGKGKIQLGDEAFDLTFEIWSEYPGKFKYVFNVSINDTNIDVTQALDGKKGWKSALGKVENLTEDELKEAVEHQHVDTVTNLYAIHLDKELKFAALGESKVGDKAVAGVLVTKKDKRDVQLYFDKQTNLLVKAEYRAQDIVTKMEVTQEKLYSEYKELVQGIKLPSKMMILNDGKPFLELEVADASLGDRHDVSIFAKPD